MDAIEILKHMTERLTGYLEGLRDAAAADAGSGERAAPQK